MGELFPRIFCYGVRNGRHAGILKLSTYKPRKAADMGKRKSKAGDLPVADSHNAAAEDDSGSDEVRSRDMSR